MHPDRLHLQAALYLPYTQPHTPLSRCSSHWFILPLWRRHKP